MVINDKQQKIINDQAAKNNFIYSHQHQLHSHFRFYDNDAIKQLLNASF